MSDVRLWESDHPYYMTEGNYFSRGWHTNWESLSLFLEEFGSADIDLNLVIRWDWREGDEWGLAEYNGSDTDRIARLMVQMVLQRKAILASHEIKVCRNDEPAARAFLEMHAAQLANNWAPICVGTDRESGNGSGNYGEAGEKDKP